MNGGAAQAAPPFPFVLPWTPSREIADPEALRLHTCSRPQSFDMRRFGDDAP